MEFIKFKYHKQLIPFSLFFIISLFIWFDGPLIKVHGYFLLQDVEKRVDLIGLCFLLWLFKVLFLDVRLEKKSRLEPIDVESKRKLDYLKGRFQGAIKFLKSTVINRNGKNINLVHLPWYLVLGPSGSGKTTLLANSDVKYILAKQFKAEKYKSIPSSDTCNWWVTRDLVLVDVPGSYLVSKAKNMPNVLKAFPLLWQLLLNLLRRIRENNKLQGVIVTLHLPELMQQGNNQKKNEIISDLKKRLIDVFDTFGKSMPIHLVITKCDLLSGFKDFFGESSRDEAGQAWGVTLPACQENESLLTTFVQRFNALIKRLNKQLIWRLHQERNASARPYIKDFPLQVERLKESIVQVLRAISIPQLPLCSVYLTSSTQYDAEESTAMTLSSAETYFTSQPAGIMSIPEMPSRAYFIRQFILHHLLMMPAKPDVMIKDSIKWRRRVAFIAAISAIACAGALLGRDFQQSVQQAYSVKKDLAQYQLNVQQAKEQNDHLILALPLLDSLQQAANAEANKLFLTFYLNKSKKTARIAYHQALQTIVLPEVQNYFKKYLQTANNKNPEQVYRVLKAYLMLSNPTHFQVKTMAEIMQQLIPDAGDKATILALTNHIQAAALATTLVEQDNELIAKVRKQLLGLSSSALGFVILKNMGNNNIDDAIDLGTLLGHPPVLVSKAVATVIPAMFTEKKFNRILSSEINIAAAEALQGNWVLGSNVVPDQMAVDALAAQLRTEYIGNYVDIWESLLANVQLNVPKDLIQLDAMLTMLTGDKSPLLQLLDTIKVNTAIESITTASPKLQSLNLLLTSANNDKPNALYSIFMSLQELHIYLQTILNSSDMNASLNQAVALHLKKANEDPITHIHLIAEQSPEPMKTWLNTIASKSWYFISQDPNAIN